MKTPDDKIFHGGFGSKLEGNLLPQKEVDIGIARQFWECVETSFLKKKQIVLKNAAIFF